MILFQIVEVIASWLEIEAGIVTISKLLGHGRIEWRDSTVISMLSAMLIFAANHLHLLSPVATAAGVMFIAGSVKMLYKEKINDCIMMAIAYVMVIYVIDFAMVSILGIINGDSQFGSKIIADYSHFRLYYICMTKLILILSCTFIIKKCEGKIKSIGGKTIVALGLFGLIILYFGYLTIQETNMQLLVMWVILGILSYFGIYGGAQYIEYQNEKNQLKLLGERNLMFAESYENIIQNYRNNQIYNHDLKNHYLVLEGLIKGKDFKAAEEYIDAMKGRRETELHCWTGINAVDILLDYKMEEAGKNNIHFEIVSDKIELKLSTQEMIALFGNALDNAVEACKNMKVGVRWIKLSIRKVQGMTFIKVSNPYSKPLEQGPQQLFLTKHDKKEYGWGLASMKLIVDQYEGTISQDYEKGHFTLMISFFN